MVTTASHYEEPHVSYSRVMAHESLWIDSNDIPEVAPSPLYDLGKQNRFVNTMICLILTNMEIEPNMINLRFKK